MKRIVTFSSALFLMLLCVAGVFFIRSHQKLGKPGVKVVAQPVFDPEGVRIAEQSAALPEKVLDFNSTVVPIPKAEWTFLPRDTTFGRRDYTNASGFNFVGTIILMGKDRTSIHKPQFCLVGQGWHIDKSEIVPLRIERPYPYDLQVMKITASQQQAIEGGGSIPYTALYVYWFVADNNLTPEHSQRVWSMLRVLLEKGVLERWAYISYFTICHPGEEDAVFEKLSRAICASVPEVQLASGKPVAGARVEKSAEAKN